MRFALLIFFQENEAKSGRNCNNVGSEGWKVKGPIKNQSDSSLHIFNSRIKLGKFLVTNCCKNTVAPTSLFDLTFRSNQRT